MPAGGMDCVRNFLTTFSQVSAAAPTLCAPDGSITNPPVFIRSLWQVTQYCVSTGDGSHAAVAGRVLAAAAFAGAFGCDAALPACCCADPMIDRTNTVATVASGTRCGFRRAESHTTRLTARLVLIRNSVARTTARCAASQQAR